MIDIISDKKELIRSLRELEFDFEQGNISKRTYYKQKRQITEKLETMDAADRIRRLQGKKTAEKPLEYWTEKKQEEDDLKEREELLKKYVTPSSTHPTTRSMDKSGNNWSKAIIVGFILVGFIMGTSFGVMLISPVTDSPAVSMVVNDTALTMKNQTNSTSTSTSTSTNYTSYSSSSSSNPSYPRNTTN